MSHDYDYDGPGAWLAVVLVAFVLAVLAVGVYIGLLAGRALL